MALTGPGNADARALDLLVLRCQAGDEQAFAQLFEIFAARIHRYLQGLVGDAADDAQQEVWITVYRHIATLANPAAFRTWLFRTARHRAVDILRRSRREAELFSDVDADTLDAARGDDDAPTALDGEALAAALTGLRAPQREVVLLRYRDGMSYKDMALVVGVPIGTIRTRLHHAKRRLEITLKGDEQ